jgi:hypothetical protein
MAIARVSVMGVLATTPYAPLLAGLFPWSLPDVVLARQATTELRATALLAGTLGRVLVAVLGCWEVIRRDVARGRSRNMDGSSGTALATWALRSALVA